MAVSQICPTGATRLLCMLGTMYIMVRHDTFLTHSSPQLIQPGLPHSNNYTMSQNFH